MVAFYASIVAILLVILGLLLYLVFTRSRVEVEAQGVKASILESLRELGLDEAIGSIKSIGNEMKESSARVLKLLEIKSERFAYGELQLEELLKDGLGKELFGWQEDIKDLGRPDAYIKSADGIICLDCKFPLENYRGIVESANEKERGDARRSFLRDIQKHIESVTKYVRPDKGTLPFAFLFVPSEAVYQYLVQEEPALIRQASSKGVILASPATLYAGLHLVKLGIRGKELSQRGKEIEQKIEALSRPLKKLGEAWEVTKGHIVNAYTKKEEVDRWYTQLAEQHQKVSARDEEENQAKSG